MTRGKKDNCVDSVEAHQQYASPDCNTSNTCDVRATGVRPTGHIPSTKNIYINK